MVVVDKSKPPKFYRNFFIDSSWKFFFKSLSKGGRDLAFVYHHCIIINKVGALWEDIHCFSFCILFFVRVVVGFSHYFSETTRISSASPRKSSSVSSKSAKKCGYGVVVILVFVFIVVLLKTIIYCCCIYFDGIPKKKRKKFVFSFFKKVYQQVPPTCHGRTQRR